MLERNGIPHDHDVEDDYGNDDDDDYNDDDDDDDGCENIARVPAEPGNQKHDMTPPSAAGHWLSLQFDIYDDHDNHDGDDDDNDHDIHDTCC